VLLALVVLVPGAALTAMSVGTFDHLAGLPVIQDVSRCTAAHYGGAEVRLLDRRVVTASSAAGLRDGVPADTELVIATIRVDASRVPAKQADTCDAELVDPGPDGDRVWRAGGSRADYSSPSGYSIACLLSPRPAYRYQAVFLVPRGVGATAELRLSAFRQAPRELRLR
jgi:hypothetical protein